MKKILPLLILVFLFSCKAKTAFQLQSPNYELLVAFHVNDDNLVFNTIFQNDTLIEHLETRLSSGNAAFFSGLEVIDDEVKSVDKSWNTVNGKNRIVLNKYNLYEYQLRNDSGDEFFIQIRLYDDGFAYRFRFSESNGNLKERGKINCSPENIFWAYNGEHHNIGPEKLAVYSEIIIRNPVVFQTPNQNYFAIHEGAIFEHEPFTLTKSGMNTLVLEQKMKSENEMLKSSWRAFIIFMEDKESYRVISNQAVNNESVLKIKMAPGGGHSMWIRPLE